MNKQLFFQFPQLCQPRDSDIIVADFNYDVMEFLFKPHQWLSNFLCVYGEAGVGKSFLTQRFIHLYQGKEIFEKHIKHISEIEKITAKYKVLLFEDFEKFCNSKNEVCFFNLYNTVQVSTCKLIITSAIPLQHMPIKLPDLHSRLKSITSLRINNPNDVTLQQLFVKIIADKQIFVSKEVVDYVFKRIQRDMPAIINLTNKMEKYILEYNKPITLKSIQQLI